MDKYITNHDNLPNGGHYPLKKYIAIYVIKTSPIFALPLHLPHLQSLNSNYLYPLPRLSQDVNAYRDTSGCVVCVVLLLLLLLFLFLLPRRLLPSKSLSIFISEGEWVRLLNWIHPSKAGFYFEKRTSFSHHFYKFLNTNLSKCK